MQMTICGFVFTVIVRTFVTCGHVRLINSPERLKGELQLLKDGIWSYVCSSNWTPSNTKVMCRMLRNSTYSGSSFESTISASYQSCWYNIACSGNEQSIDKCIHGYPYQLCLLSETVAVRCDGDKVMASSASLHGASRNRSGYCKFVFVCSTYSEGYAEKRGYMICLYNITCSGNEQSIDKCMNGVVYQSCLLSETVMVRCGFSVRLVDGYNVNEGKVEIGVNGTWRPVANTNNSWGNKEANVICSMLGYRSKNAIGIHTPTFTEVRCDGKETTFERCSLQKGNSSACAHYVYLDCRCNSVQCLGSNFSYCDQFLGTCQPGCSPGRYVEESYCYPCSPGTYQPATNQNRCYYCPFGTYQNLTGQIACQACPVGQYLSMIGSEKPCNACPPGTYQDQTGQMSCKQCSIGTYQNKAEQAACIACEQGTYQNSSGKTACIPCAGGNTTVRQGSTTQYECYKAFSQRDDLPQQTKVNILIVGATFLAGVIIFDIISCAILMRRIGWRSKNSSNTKSDIHQTYLKQIVPGCETANTNDTLNSRHRQDVQVNQREYVNDACLEQEHEYIEVH